jgi:hypothetical protein
MRKGTGILRWFYFFGGVIFYVFLSFLLSSYGNRPMHEFINERIAGDFLKKMSQYPELKDYSISASDKIPGVGVTVKGGRTITEGEMSFTFKDWIKHGGFSADEPEWLMALRHFYDPKSLDGGKKYLTDIPLGLGVANPEIDIVEWALEDKGEITKGTTGVNPLFQKYSWMDGKNSIVAALNEKDKPKREKLMAHAWRSLGETLHALGDMACPVHVRNDGHPPGDADPFENGITLDTHIPTKPGDYWDQDLIDRVKSKGNLRDFFHELAVYTNENFFTNQTVHGIGIDTIKPSLRPAKPYTLPFVKLGGPEWKYEADEFTFYKKFGNNWVKMCKDRYYFAYALPTGMRTAKAYVDLDVAESQAKVLLSNLLGVAPDLMRRFFPVIRPIVEGADPLTQEINGSVRLEKSTEYPNELKYNSWVLVYNKTTGKSEEVAATNGNFKTSDLSFKTGDELQAYVVMGGLQVAGEKYKVSDSDLRNLINKTKMIQIIGGVQVKYNNSTQFVGHHIGVEFCIGADSGCQESFGPGPTYTIRRGVPGDNKNYEQLFLEFEQDYKTIKRFFYEAKGDSESSGIIEKGLTEIDLNAIPFVEKIGNEVVRYGSNLSNGTFKFNYYRNEPGTTPWTQNVTEYDGANSAVNVIFRTQ